MRITMTTMLALGLMSILLSGCGEVEKSAEASCLCEQGKAGESVWCEKCDTGYVGGTKTDCPATFESRCAADAPDAAAKGCCGGCKGAKTECKGCLEAKQGGPACKACAGE